MKFDTLKLTFEDALFRGSIFEQIEKVLGRALDDEERRYVDSTSFKSGFLSFDGRLYSRSCEERLVECIALTAYQQKQQEWRHTEVTVWVSGSHESLSDDQLRDLIHGKVDKIIVSGDIECSSFTPNWIEPGHGSIKPGKNERINIIRESPGRVSAFKGNHSYESMKSVKLSTKMEVEIKGGKYV